MKLKKILPHLQQSLEQAGLTEPTELQRETFGPIKSGVDLVIGGLREEGKTTAIVINVIQRLDKAPAGMIAPRALIIVKDKEKMLEMMELFAELGKHTDLRIYGVHDKTNLDEDKNQISVGIDVLIGTPIRLNDMFGGAGFDVNQLKMLIVDDVEELLRNRLEPKIARLSNSIGKTQRLFFTDVITERVEFLADRLMVEPMFMETGEDDEDDYDEFEDDDFDEDFAEDFNDFDEEAEDDSESDNEDKKEEE
ncbi:DEAD/DEAH box helicase [Flavobacterium sp. RNTU_13]|uniref:DEAD/DEAH box helicase n=1 Tax=Flavobacterium sp. RNTU_13 TaxID=3375145 RepID=UPI003986AA0E